MLSAGLGTVGFSWAASPSCTELETIVLHWLGKMLHLPKVFMPLADINTDMNVAMSNGKGPVSSSEQNCSGHSTARNDVFAEGSEAEEDSEALLLDDGIVGGGVILVSERPLFNLHKIVIFGILLVSHDILWPLILGFKYTKM